ncbi:MAG: DUF6090 family protein [Saprospiraceae bacterium]|nr:DUF6090 family protein [Saprospiraceae bacterium]
MRKWLRQFNWKYAIGEILFIFIGITMAIWFNNWNETRKAQTTEIKSLKELRNALQQDVYDIQDNILGFKYRVDLYEDIIEHIESNTPFGDSLKTRLSLMMGITTFIPNTGAYETLKSRGLETITDDSIRLSISLHYDYHYESIQASERRHFLHRQEYIKPQVLQKLDFSNQLHPVNSEDLLHDFEFKQIIYWAYLTDGGMQDRYENMLKKCTSLIQLLNQEIEELN